MRNLQWKMMSVYDIHKSCWRHFHLFWPAVFSSDHALFLLDRTDETLLSCAGETKLVPETHPGAPLILNSSDLNSIEHAWYIVKNSLNFLQLHPTENTQLWTVL